MSFPANSIWKDSEAASLSVGNAAGFGIDTDDGRLYVNRTGTREPLPTGRTEVVTATNTILAEEDGSTYFLNSATEFVSTLPLPAAGLRFTFIVTAAPSGASYTIVSSASANIIKGQVYTLDVNSATDADLETAGGDTISFVDAKSVAGDRVDLFCDGTNWFAYGFCSVFDAIIITTAS